MNAVPGWAFALLCIAVPGVWAVLVARVVRARESRKTQFSPTEKPPSDYSI